MKMKPEHYAYLKTALSKLDIAAIERAVKEDGKYKDLDKRVRWDCLYKANISAWICSNLYSYCDDGHVDTALKQAVKELRQ